MRRRAVLGAVALIAIAVSSRRAEGQGFGVYEHDACAMARAGAAVASPCAGGSAVFFNPAGILGSPNRWNVSFGGTLITLDFHYRDSASAQTTDAVKNAIPVPAAYVTRQMGPKWALGFGVYAPYGLIVEWPTDFRGRFLAYRSDLAAAYFQPTIAYQPFRQLRVGAGLAFGHSRVELKQRVDLSAQVAAPGLTFAHLGVPAGTDFADAVVSGSSNSATGHFGVIFEPSPRVSIGARYLMSMTADIRGKAKFTQINTGITLAPGNPLGAPGGTSLDALVASQFATGLLTTQNASTNIPLPDQFVLGVAVKVTPQFSVMGDWQWTHWEQFAALPLVFEKLPTRTLYEDYRNTNGFRIGAEYRATKFTVRGGWLTHEGAAPPQTVTPLLPEGARTEFTGGIGVTLSPRMRFDLAYQMIQQQDRRGRTTEPAVRGRAGAAVNSGLYTGTANLFGASLALGF